MIIFIQIKHVANCLIEKLSLELLTFEEATSSGEKLFSECNARILKTFFPVHPKAP